MNARPTGEAQKQFEALFQRSYQRAYRLACRLAGNPADAEDITQDAYVRAWNNFARYDARSSFESWLFRIITHRAIDLHRRQQRVRMSSLDVSVQGKEGEPLTPEFAAPDSDPGTILINQSVDERLQKAIADLSHDNRQTFLLYALEQRSYQEIAESMNCALGTVRSRIHRGRQSILRSLARMSSPNRSESDLDRGEEHHRERTRPTRAEDAAWSRQAASCGYGEDALSRLFLCKVRKE